MTNRQVLVAAECPNGAPSALTRELLGLARTLAGADGTVSAATLLGGEESLIAHGADVVFALGEGSTGDRYLARVWLHALGELLSQHPHTYVLFGHTALGSELGPRLAFRLKAAIATACEHVEVLEGELVATRPCFGNKAREVLALKTAPSLVTVREKAYEPLEPNPRRNGRVVRIAVSPDGAESVRIVARHQENLADAARLETAKIVVAGGRGLGGADGFKVLERLAAAVGGALGGSRVACDLGWCPRGWQIGLSGKTVTPELYVAVGISGASHHLAGCGKARAILAINTDPQAAIFKDASYGVVGDYKKIIPALVEELEKERSAQPT